MQINTKQALEKIANKKGEIVNDSPKLSKLLL